MTKKTLLKSLSFQTALWVWLGLGTEQDSIHAKQAPCQLNYIPNPIHHFLQNGGRAQDNTFKDVLPYQPGSGGLSSPHSMPWFTRYFPVRTFTTLSGETCPSSQESSLEKVTMSALMNCIPLL